MRTAFKWRAPAFAATCLIGLATAGLGSVEQAAAQQGGEVYYVGGSQPTPAEAQAAPAQNAAPGTCGGGACNTSPGGSCTACPADETCPACSGRGCKHCNGTGIFRGCPECRKALRDEHRGLLCHHGYWDGRHECEEAPYGVDDCGRCYEPRWAVTAGALVLKRSTARKGVIIGHSNGQSGVTDSLVSMDDMNLDWAAGPRVTLMRRFEACDIEFVYWGIDSWHQERAVTGDRLAVLVDGFGGQTYGMAGAAYQSRLYNAESNLKLRMAEAVNLILGARVMELHEKFFVGAGTSSGQTLDEVTDNYLYGFQIGADTDVPVWAGLSFNAFIKAGVFGNHANIRSTVTSIPSGAVSGGSFSDDPVAFVGEVGVMGTYQVTKNIGVYGGYEYMWIDGVYLAPDMVTTVVRTNTPAFNGALFGLTLQW